MVQGLMGTFSSIEQKFTPPSDQAADSPAFDHRVLVGSPDEHLTAGKPTILYRRPPRQRNGGLGRCSGRTARPHFRTLIPLEGIAAKPSSCVCRYIEQGPCCLPAS